MKKITSLIIVAVLCCGLLASCGGNKGDDTSTDKTTVNDKTTVPVQTDAVTEADATNAGGTASSDKSAQATALAAEVKKYITETQKSEPEAAQLKWSNRFIEAADLTGTVEKYLNDGGKADDVKAAAEYVTENAPVAENWKQLFEKDFAESFEDKIVKYESIGNDSFTVYVNKDGKETAFVTVNSRTGYYHG